MTIHNDEMTEDYKMPKLSGSHPLLCGVVPLVQCMRLKKKRTKKIQPAHGYPAHGYPAHGNPGWIPDNEFGLEVAIAVRPLPLSVVLLAIHHECKRPPSLLGCGCTSRHVVQVWPELSNVAPLQGHQCREYI